MVLDKLAGVEHLAVLAAFPGHRAAAGKHGLAGFTHVDLDVLAQAGFPLLRRIQLQAGLQQLRKGGVERLVVAQVHLVAGIEGVEATQSLLAAF